MKYKITWNTNFGKYKTNTNGTLVIAMTYALVVPYHKESYLWQCIESNVKTMDDDNYDSHYVLLCTINHGELLLHEESFIIYQYMLLSRYQHSGGYWYLQYWYNYKLWSWH